MIDAVCLFHVHDNLGARRDGTCPPGIDPLRLDLHLPPGSGRLPWRRWERPWWDAESRSCSRSHPPHRPEPLSLASVTTELLLRERPSVGGAPRSALASVPLG